MYADKILKGSKPSQLAVKRPTTYELIINARSAKALGIVLSAELLARADEVIE
jgi:putative tryptophan/tyrosine transport system substrate-binding protein